MGPSQVRHACGIGVCTVILGFAVSDVVAGEIAIRGETVHTMAGPPISHGIVVVRDGKIAAIGKADDVPIPAGVRVVDAKVVTPGLVDGHSTVGLSGIFNYDHDQDQLESSESVQPELRALDAYNAKEELVEWIRSFGVTTIHTGHGPGELISGQTLVVKTSGNTVEQAALVKQRAVAATLAASAQKEGASAPGTRGKMLAMLRTEFIRAKEYSGKQQAADADATKDAPERNLRLETLAEVLQGKLPLLVTAHRAQDIASALRLAKEFEFTLWLDGGAEAYLLVDEIKAAGIPVFVHPTMSRPIGELENFSFETAGILAKAGIPIVLQSSFEAYVPKTRVLLFEAGLAAAHGLPWETAMATITIDAARILGVADRVGSLEVGKDGDLAMYDGDPLEYTTHCTGVVIEGQLVSDKPR